MLRRWLGIAILFLALAPSAHAATLGLAEVLGSNGQLLAQARGGAFAYPEDGSVLRVGDAHAYRDRVELRDVVLFNGRIFAERVVVPATRRGVARIDGLIVDGRGYRVGSNTLVPMVGGSYVVALQQAVVPGRAAAGLVGLRVYVAEPSLGVPGGTQLLVGVARAARPKATAPKRQATAWDVLGLTHTRGTTASLAGVPALIPQLTLGDRAVAIAERYLGIPYVWGGATPSGFDCSGLTMFVYAQLGIELLHYTGFQIHEGTPVPRSQLRPGDLVFFYPDGNGVPEHEGIYIGGGRFIHAPHTGDVVKISSLYDPGYALSFVGAVRPYTTVPGAPVSFASGSG